MPGFGKYLIKSGLIANRKYGAAKPIASDKKMLKEIISGCTNAKPKAAPMKGAVHGDATITESAPVKNDPTNPWELLLFSSFESDDPSEIFPSSISPTKKIKILNEETTVGDCN